MKGKNQGKGGKGMKKEGKRKRGKIEGGDILPACKNSCMHPCLRMRMTKQTRSSAVAERPLDAACH